MAHRNIKITRDIVQTCNKIRALSKIDLCNLPPEKAAELSAKASENVHNNKFLEVVSNDIRNEYKEEEKIISEINVTKYLNDNIKSTFPKSIKKPPSNAAITQNGIIFNLENLRFGITSRNITSSSLLPTTAKRLYSTKKKDDACKVVKKCEKNMACPRYLPPNCEPSKGSDCRRRYIDPCCAKKMAPYPSYSELCAYRLEDDPSECQQCPWQKCGGVDDIKPQKKYYHTSTRQFNMAMIPGKIQDIAPFIINKECDASKEPCKEPPPRCPRKEPKKDKCPEKKKKEKKKCNAPFAPVESWVISGSMRNLDLQRYYFSQAKVEKLRSEIGPESNMAERIAYNMKDCPKEEKKCPKRIIKPPVVDHRIQEQYRPKDPCCEDAKKGRPYRKKPKIYVPEPRDY